MHVRKQIRAAIYNALDGNTSAVTLIDGGVFPFNDNQLPGIQIKGREEEIDEERGRIERLQFRAGQFEIVVHAKADALIDDTLDSFAEEIETAVLNDLALKSLTNCIDLLSTTYDTSPEGEKEAGIMTMVVQAKYITDKGQPGVLK